MECGACRRPLPAGVSTFLTTQSQQPALARPIRGKTYKEYEYTDLKDRRASIRVLILRGNGDHNSEVECELKTISFVRKEPLEHNYEALSYCWGTSAPTGRVIIVKEGKVQKRVFKRVTPDLESALKALRHSDRSRYLWIDQVCINQSNMHEKNHQVEMMSQIYGRAIKVCIWLGVGDFQSSLALNFIKTEVLQLNQFDELCKSEYATKKWTALLELLQRPWFSRRWCVQELALAHKAVIYCGADKIAWKKFAVAVELFVEVETASHRLSEVIKKDPTFYHVPGWFDHVSALGASQLVEATGKLFRDYKPNRPAEPGDSDSEGDSDEDEDDGEGDVDDGDQSSISDAGQGEEKKDEQEEEEEDDAPSFDQKSLGQPLLTLEYLVSSFSIFDMSNPHDAIYSLLAIAKDTTPLAPDNSGFRRSLMATQDVLEGFTQKKRYEVDYEKPFADVCQEFVRFCIKQSKDETRALDIICRPWAPETELEHDTTSSIKLKKEKRRKLRHKGKEKEKPPNPEVSSEIRMASSSEQHRNSINAQPPSGVLENGKKRKHDEIEVTEEKLPLPSWVQSLSGAAYALYPQSGSDTNKMGRKNADTLVGLPPSSQSLERNYNAAETRKIDMKTLRFVKRPQLGHWALYVKGFILDTVKAAYPSSQNGAIPRSWTRAGGWHDVRNKDPPDAFWRTLVADRGQKGKNPPVYYSHACKESFARGGYTSGSVDTTNLINNERCSIIAEFCRRVQAVIWNRCLVTTEKGKLGLTSQDVKPGDLICILYGCSVPVLLRRRQKTPEDVRKEATDRVRWLEERLTHLVRKHKLDKRYHRIMRNGHRALNYAWRKKLWKEWESDKDGLQAWRKKRQCLTFEQNKDGVTTCDDAIFEGLGETFTIIRESHLQKPESPAKARALDYTPDMALNVLTTDEPSQQILVDKFSDRPKQMALLQRKEFEAWKKKKEENWKQRREDLQSLPKGKLNGEQVQDLREIARESRSTVREANRRYELQFRYGRRWKMQSPSQREKKKKAAEKATAEKAANERRPSQKLQAGSNGWPQADAGVDTVRVVEEANDLSQPNSSQSQAQRDRVRQRFQRLRSAQVSIPEQDDLPETQAAYQGPAEGEGTSGTEESNFKNLYYENYLRDHRADPESDKLEIPDWPDDGGDDDVRKLRDKWEYHEFKGECYLHGMMDGEAMASQNEHMIPTHVFELR